MTHSRALMKVLFEKVARDQRVRFVGVGVVNTLIGYALYATLTLSVFRHVSTGYLYSLISSYAIVICVAFLLYRRFVFIVRGNLVRDFVRFVSVYALSIALNTVLLPIAVELVLLHPLVAQLAVLAITTTVSYVGHRRFSFRRAK